MFQQSLSVRTQLVVLFVLAVLARLTACLFFSGNLGEDRDSYLALAETLAGGEGFSAPDTNRPTAYRPPAYPLLLLMTGAVWSRAALAALHALLGGFTAGLTMLCGRRLALPGGIAFVAGLLCALDPLLVWYATFPMTETLAAALTAAIFWLLARELDGNSHGSLRGRILLGIVCGIAVLSRPTMLAVFPLWVVSWIALKPLRRSLSVRKLVQIAIPCAAILATWATRNLVQLGTPIVATSHGGYTLLLGNNPVFYDEVVGRPWGTVWNDNSEVSQAEWVRRIQREMEMAGVRTEVAQDRWMRNRAVKTIRDEPGQFLAASRLRFLRFWSLSPVAGTHSTPAIIVWFITLYYAVLWLMLLIGAVQAVYQRRPLLLAALIMITAFSLVHLIYWSNARMRAPVVPAIALLAAASMAGGRPARQASVGYAP